MTTMTDELPDLNKLPDHTPRHKLITLLEFMKGRDMLSEYGQRSAINFFMDWIGNLYLEYYQFHLDEANEIGKKHEEVLLSLLEPIHEVNICGFVRKIQSAGEYEDELWEKACWKKTNLEAFHEMFGDITGYIEGYGVEELDEYMKIESYQCIKRENIPENAPKHHWWWFMYFGKRRDEKGFQLNPEEYP